MSFSVKDIAKTLKDNKKQGLPVIIFTGAGCSKKCRNAFSERTCSRN